MTMLTHQNHISQRIIIFHFLNIRRILKEKLIRFRDFLSIRTKNPNQEVIQDEAQKDFLEYTLLTFGRICFFLKFLQPQNTVSLEKSVDFSLEHWDYTQNNLVLVNGKSYPIDLKGNSHRASKVYTEIEVKIGEEGCC